MRKKIKKTKIIGYSQQSNWKNKKQLLAINTINKKNKISSQLNSNTNSQVIEKVAL